jgi:hypothetical protein
MADDDHKPIGWEKPSWTTSNKLKSTGKSAAGNLAKPITNLPHQKDGSAPGFTKPQWTGDHKESGIQQDNLAKPITNLPHGAGAGSDNLAFEKPEWTKGSGLKESGKGSKLKEGKDMARPIGGIKPIDDE